MIDRTSPYTQPGGCACGRHSQHTVYRFLFYHPGSSLKLAARELGMTHLAVRLAKHRLSKRKDLHLICPECFEPTLRNLVCQSCGVELEQPFVLEESFDSQSPAHSIQPLGGLGSVTNYRGLKLQYGGANVQHIAERPDNLLLERCRSLLWEELKGPMFRDSIVEEASTLLIRSVSEFQARFPSLAKSKGVASQLVENVVDLLRLRYPNRFAVSASTPVLEAEKDERRPGRDSHNTEK